MAIEQLRTVADYQTYVESLPPTSPKAELINGRIVMAARPNAQHMKYQLGILEAFFPYLRKHQYKGQLLSEFEVVLDEHTLLVPDLGYLFEGSTLGKMTNQSLHGAPDWVCEIASPSTQKQDEQEKYLAYLKAGAREYWLVDPDAPAGKRFRLFERVEEGPTSGMPAFQRIEGGPSASKLFPGITIDQKLL